MTRRSTAVHEQPGTDAGVVASTIQVGPQAADSRFMPVLSIDSIFESPQNPRKHFDPTALQELEQSIREKGVLTPVLVRPVPGWSVTPETIRPRQYELAAGHRRFRAAKAAGLDALPAVAREMTDAELLEVLVIENDQREDVHPLEEAAGYLALMRTAKYDVARIAARTGRSAKYVYDRLKLMELIPKAQALFMAGKFSAGHAILLARLKPEDQKRALTLEHRDRGLFRSENGIPFREEDERADEKDPYHLATPRSVREFEGWIQDRVRAEVAHVDPFLFPDTAAILEERKADKLKAIQITSEYRASDDVREAAKGERILGQAMWKRADGKEGSKTCARSRVGFVACGPGQGEAFVVCANKDKCEVHWGSDIRARKKRQSEIAKGGAPAKKARDRYAEEEKKRQEERDREEAERGRWRKARPQIVEALVAAVTKAPVGVDSALGRIVHQLARCGNAIQKLVPIGKTSDDLVRHLAFSKLHDLATNEYWAARELPAQCKALGFDVRKILDQAAPVQTSAKPQAGTCRKCGCTEGAACEGGCGWVDKARTKCSSCFPPKLAKKGGKR